MHNVLMLILLVDIHVKPEHIEAFKIATTENASNGRKEPGVARFDFLQDTDNPAHFSLVEVYRDQDAVVAHKLTAHYLAWVDLTADMFAEPRTRALFTNVSPDDDGF
jgi:(4S)-4-hydroxy-5-phosphonooxypentane-2,3-dione isomerase